MKLVESLIGREVSVGQGSECHFTFIVIRCYIHCYEICAEHVVHTWIILPNVPIINYEVTYSFRIDDTFSMCNREFRNQRWRGVLKSKPVNNDIFRNDLSRRLEIKQTQNGMGPNARIRRKPVSICHVYCYIATFWNSAERYHCWWIIESPRAQVAKFYGRLQLIRSGFGASKLSVLKIDSNFNSVSLLHNPFWIRLLFCTSYNVLEHKGSLCYKTA